MAGVLDSILGGFQKKAQAGGYMPSSGGYAADKSPDSTGKTQTPSTGTNVPAHATSATAAPAVQAPTPAPTPAEMGAQARQDAAKGFGTNAMFMDRAAAQQQYTADRLAAQAARYGDEKNKVRTWGSQKDFDAAYTQRMYNAYNERLGQYDALNKKTDKTPEEVKELQRRSTELANFNSNMDAYRRAAQSYYAPQQAASNYQAQQAAYRAASRANQAVESAPAYVTSGMTQTQGSAAAPQNSGYASLAEQRAAAEKAYREAQAKGQGVDDARRAYEAAQKAVMLNMNPALATEQDRKEYGESGRAISAAKAEERKNYKAQVNNKEYIDSMLVGGYTSSGDLARTFGESSPQSEIALRQMLSSNKARNDGQMKSQIIAFARSSGMAPDLIERASLEGDVDRDAERTRKAFGQGERAVEGPGILKRLADANESVKRNQRINAAKVAEKRLRKKNPIGARIADDTFGNENASQETYGTEIAGHENTASLNKVAYAGLLGSRAFATEGVGALPADGRGQYADNNADSLAKWLRSGRQGRGQDQGFDLSFLSELISKYGPQAWEMMKQYFDAGKGQTPTAATKQPATVSDKKTFDPGTLGASSSSPSVNLVRGYTRKPVIPAVGPTKAMASVLPAAAANTQPTALNKHTSLEPGIWDAGDYASQKIATWRAFSMSGGDSSQGDSVRGVSKAVDADDSETVDSQPPTQGGSGESADPVAGNKGPHTQYPTHGGADDAPIRVPDMTMEPISLPGKTTADAAEESRRKKRRIELVKSAAADDCGVWDANAFLARHLEAQSEKVGQQVFSQNVTPAVYKNTATPSTGSFAAATGQLKPVVPKATKSNSQALPTNAKGSSITSVDTQTDASKR